MLTDVNLAVLERLHQPRHRPRVPQLAQRRSGLTPHARIGVLQRGNQAVDGRFGGTLLRRHAPLARRMEDPVERALCGAVLRGHRELERGVEEDVARAEEDGAGFEKRANEHGQRRHGLLLLEN